MKHILDRVEQLLIQGWTQWSSARALDHCPVSSDSTEAVCWCITGALNKVSNDIESYSDIIETAGLLLRTIRLQAPGIRAIAEWNDAHDRTQAQVIALVRQARESLSATPAPAGI